MNRNASGTPPKLAKTPEAVVTMRRRARPRGAVCTAYAISSPSTAGTTEVSSASSRLVTKPFR